MSTFHGLEMAKQALFAQQSALYTTANNISNANTEGYSRQRVNFQSRSPYPMASRNRPQIPGQMGTGVEAGSIQRMRNQYLDYQYRTENSKVGYWTTKSNALSRMESLLNEPSDTGLSKTMDKFWQSLQDLATNPQNSGARSVVAERGKAVAETFNYLSKSLESIRSDLKHEIEVTVKDANSIINQISAINEQIQQIEPHGYLANDLYDERDRLIDELSTIVNIQVEYSKSSSSSPANADGLATITLVDDSGNSLGVKLVDPNATNADEAKQLFQFDDSTDLASVSIGNITFPNSEKNGSLNALIRSYGYKADGEEGVRGTYPEMLANLNQIAKAFAEEFNEIHRLGTGIDEDKTTSIDFFEFDGEAGAGTIKINTEIAKDPNKIAASKDGTAGNAQNALDLESAFDAFRHKYDPIIGELGVNAQEANKMTNNTMTLRSEVEYRRMSVSSVSLDEEISNLIKFQHAYNAAARSMTAVDEMIERIINNMGLVGR